MNRREVRELLAAAARLDGREVTEDDVLAWHDLLGDLRFEDAEAAVGQHYRTSTYRMKPADVRTQVRRVREHRVAQSPASAPVDPDDVAGYMRQLREQTRAIADGRQPEERRAITERPGPGPDNAAALRKTCPWCGAAPNEWCTSKRTGARLRVLHPARLEQTAEENP